MIARDKYARMNSFEVQDFAKRRAAALKGRAMPTVRAFAEVRR